LKNETLYFLSFTDPHFSSQSITPLTENQLTSLHLTTDKKRAYQSVKAFFKEKRQKNNNEFDYNVNKANPGGNTTTNAGQTENAVVVGDGSPCLNLPHTYINRDAAQAAAQGRLNANKANRICLEATCTGAPSVVSGRLVEIDDISEGAFQGRYLVVRADHTVDASNGYTTSFTAFKMEI
jgi:phage protein D